MTEDMCVTHFLIQSDPEGVQLHGWSERAFSECVSYCMHAVCVHQKHHVPVYMYVPILYVHLHAFRFASIMVQNVCKNTTLKVYVPTYTVCACTCIM